ncbi:hypothetical protein ANDROMEDA_24 [Bacillus phage Andromeda]|uniref:Tail assembly chaperone n=4 Tax=Andromedavirus TaxID=1623275 RepID=M1IEK9_9CAUD|nr:tail assembly chaperone [Bacillus phage Andromeda]YP_007517568.1 tail assembly chaperone [Bacillus phage Curly]AGE60863.1 hypothetical protein GEMINI_24 [Bacillus phage Gemini]QMS41894.1 tail assembly chaperone [Bacillus phage Bolokhovo]AGE60711.1 hypothetical protein CURLY_24 [Bacillus phage Curly]AGE61094.1 hypothetical protein ANDROMEDA_24 [Bacillus phage Andromeda]
MPSALTKYELCKTFGWLPDELDRQDNKVIEEFLIIHNTIAELDKKQSKKDRRQEALKKYNGAMPR